MRQGVARVASPLDVLAQLNPVDLQEALDATRPLTGVKDTGLPRGAAQVQTDKKEGGGERCCAAFTSFTTFTSRAPVGGGRLHHVPGPRPPRTRPRVFRATR